jgi:Flp pilus assembly protein TadD
MAVTAVQEGDFAKAETHYRLALPGRTTAETYNGLGYVIARQGRRDEAIAEYRKAIEADATFTPAYNNLAQALAQKGELDEAARTYRLSLAQKPNAAVHNALGIVLAQLGRKDEAAAEMAKAKALGAAR